MCSTVTLLLLAATTATTPAMAAASEEIVLEYEGDDLVLEAAPNQTIQGTATLDPGTTLLVRIRSAGENPFIKSRSTTVDGDGTFAVDFDLSDHEDAPITVTVRPEHESDAETNVKGRIGSPQTSIQDEHDMPPEQDVTAGETLSLPITLPEAGTAVLRIGSEDAHYRTVVQVEDANEDGVVRLIFDAGAAGTTGPTFAVTDDDRFEVRDPEPNLQEGLPAGTYELALLADYEGDPVVIGSLVVHGDNPTTRTGSSTARNTGLVPPLSDRFWRTTAPGIAGLIALLSGLASLRISQY